MVAINWHWKEGRIIGIRARRGFLGCMVLQVLVESVRYSGNPRIPTEVVGSKWRDAKADDFQEASTLVELLRKVKTA